MNILIGLLLVLGFLFYAYIKVDVFRKTHNKVTTGIIFDVENLPDLQDEALNELMKEGF